MNSGDSLLSVLLFVPSAVLEEGRLRCQEIKNASDECLFLAGWNPRRLTVCFAGIVRATSMVAADAAVLEISKTCPAAARGLTIVGQLHADRAHFGTKTQDHSTRDIWLDISFPHAIDNCAPENAPLLHLRNAFICGISLRRKAALTVVEVDPHKLGPYRAVSGLQPARIGPCSALGLGGIRRALRGEAVTQAAPGACSPLEGHYNPEYINSLYGAIRRRQTQNETMKEGKWHGNAYLQPTKSDASDIIIETNKDTPGGSNTDVSALHFGTALTNNSFTLGRRNNTNTSFGMKDMMSLLEPQDAEAKIDPHCPPRLVMPMHHLSTTELEIVIHCVNNVPTIGQSLNGQTPSEETDDPTTNDSPVKKVTRSINTLFIGIFQPLIVIFTFLANFSYTASVLEIKLCELVNALSVSARRTNCCGLHPFVPQTFSVHSPRDAKLQRIICLKHFLARATADIVLGYFAVRLLSSNYSALVEPLRTTGSWGLYTLHMDYFEWFLGWPGGFKLNQRLSEAIGGVCIAVIHQLWNFPDLFESLCSLVLDTAGLHSACPVDLKLDFIKTAYGLLLAIAPFGFSLLFAMVADICNVATLHIRFLFHLVAVVYRGAKRVLHYFWLQFRGKHNNQLRDSRVDEWSFSSDELVLGTLLGTCCVLLFPTVLFYYCYLTAARTTILVLQESLRAVSILAGWVPLYPLYLWLTRTRFVSSGTAFSNVRVHYHLFPGNEVSGNNFNSSPITSPVLRSPHRSSTSQSRKDSVSGSGEESTSDPSVCVLPQIELFLGPLPMQFSEAVAEFLILLQYMFEVTVSPGRIIHLFKHAAEKPDVALRRDIFPHLSKSSPVHPQLHGFAPVMHTAP